MISNQQAIRGAEKAAIIMLAAGESHSVDLFKRLAESEIKEISDAMAGMSHVKAAVVETVTDRLREHRRGTAEHPTASAIQRVEQALLFGQRHIGIEDKFVYLAHELLMIRILCLAGIVRDGQGWVFNLPLEARLNHEFALSAT